MPPVEPSPKLEARRLARARLAAISRADRARASAAIANTLAAWEVFTSARVVMFYAALPDEPDVGPASRAVLGRGGVACFPRVDWGTGSMEAARIRDASQLVEADRGLRQPAPSCPGVGLDEIDLVLAPGLAFDAAGYRLGRGGGFYDRFLARRGLRAATCGVGFEASLVPELPRSSWDARLQHLVTEATLRTFVE